MGQPYVGEIRIFAGNFAPLGWAFCEGQLMPISENETLFNLIGTTYGGDGQSTFALPDLRSRVPIHQGTGNGLTTRNLASTGGVEQVAISVPTMPSHTHPFLASTDAGTQPSPIGFFPAANNIVKLYTPPTTFTPLAAASMQAIGGSQPHENLQPLLCVNFIMSLFGIFPSQS
jgi:microcystin-dependent protein